MKSAKRKIKIIKMKKHKNLHLLNSVEKKILRSMSGIDDTINLLHAIEGFDTEINKLSSLKKQLKTILNNKFDALAQRRLIEHISNGS